MRDRYVKFNAEAFLRENPQPVPPATVATPATVARDGKLGVATVADVAAPLSRRKFLGEDALNVLQRRCPDYVDAEDWQRAAEDGRWFLETWGPEAARLEWTEDDLFGLADVPPDVHPTFRRLSRYDGMGLVWLLRGRPVIALRADKAAIVTKSGTPLMFYRRTRTTHESGQQGLPQGALCHGGIPTPNRRGVKNRTEDLGEGKRAYIAQK